MARFYLVNRLRPNGREDEITTVSTVGMMDDEIRVLRETALAHARQMRSLNNWHVVVYGPDETDNPHVIGQDRVWDSETDL